MSVDFYSEFLCHWQCSRTNPKALQVIFLVQRTQSSMTRAFSPRSLEDLVVCETPWSLLRPASAFLFHCSFNNGTVECTFHYDAMGNLHEKRCGMAVTSYLVDPFGILFGSNILAEVSFSSMFCTA